MSYSIRQLQSAIFIASIDAGTRLEIAAALGKEIDELVGVDPVLIPLPENAPAELPHIVMSNDETGLQFQYAPARTDLIFNFEKPAPLEELAERLSETSSITTRVWSLLQSQFAARSRRLGLVCTFMAGAEDAASLITGRYLKGSYGKGSAEAQIHYLHKSSEGPFSVNRWVRLRSQPKSDEGEDSIFLMVDVNTIPEQSGPSVDEGTIEGFMSIGESMISKALDAHRLDK